ncbi:MAG: peptidoglycan recognition family protein [Bacteroidales bacterium]|nr:peptidoglycan recognition family protein [Bacteroidales bacterium]
MKSKLTNKTMLAHSSNYTKGRKGYKICKITPHHMSGVLSGSQCAKIFQNSKRNASANYCIGVKGDIVCSVPEENRAWTSSSSWNDCRAITIEVSNNKTGGNWTVSNASWKSLVKLCADICKRYNFKLTYDGTKNGSLTRHNMYANTDCPGKYLQSKFPDLVKEVNALLNKKESTVNRTKTLKQDCVLYSNKDLTGTKYTYKKNTTVKILKNIDSKVDYVQVIATKRKAYINKKYYK